MNALQPFLNKVTQGDCIHVLRRFPDQCIDFVLTDPPYLVKYQDKDGRKVANDDNPRWIFPAFAEVYRVLRPDRYCVSFYGWGKVEKFLAVWKELGLFPVGHFVFVKPYASKEGHTQMRHEQAYLLAKGRPQPPGQPPPDVVEFDYSGNGLHPTQKPVTALTPLLMAYSEAGEIVLDPFAGSGSTGIAARETSRTLRADREGPQLCAHRAQPAVRGTPLPGLNPALKPKGGPGRGQRESLSGRTCANRLPDPQESPMRQPDLFQAEVKPPPKPAPPVEYKVVALRECPAPEYLRSCDTPQHAADYWRQCIVSTPHYDPEKECFVVLLLTTRRRVKGHHVVGIGLLDQVLVHAREVFRPAIVAAAHAVVVMHNHPGGDPTPSEADIRATRDLIRAGQLLRIEVLDHIIVTPFRHSSLRELGWFHQ